MGPLQAHLGTTCTRCAVQGAIRGSARAVRATPTVGGPENRRGRQLLASYRRSPPPSSTPAPCVQTQTLALLCLVLLCGAVWTAEANARPCKIKKGERRRRAHQLLPAVAPADRPPG